MRAGPAPSNKAAQNTEDGKRGEQKEKEERKRKKEEGRRASRRNEHQGSRTAGTPSLAVPASPSPLPVSAPAGVTTNGSLSSALLATNTAHPPLGMILIAVPTTSVAQDDFYVVSAAHGGASDAHCPTCSIFIRITAQWARRAPHVSLPPGVVFLGPDTTVHEFDLSSERVVLYAKIVDASEDGCHRFHREWLANVPCSNHPPI